MIDHLVWYLSGFVFVVIGGVLCIIFSPPSKTHTAYAIKIRGAILTDRLYPTEEYARSIWVNISGDWTIVKVEITEKRS
jgi:hypothetical protein